MVTEPEQATSHLAARMPVVVSVEGEHDCSTVERLSLQLAEAFADGQASAVVDLSEVTFMDVSVLRLLQRTRDHLAETNRSLIVANPSRPAWRLLHACEAISPLGLRIEHEWPRSATPSHDRSDAERNLPRAQ